jgi:DNA mismatch repair protein MutS2
MAPPLATGQLVRTPLGTGTVREVRANGQVCVEIRGRSLVVRTEAVVAIDPPRRRPPPGRTAPPDAPVGVTTTDTAPAEIDLHGLTVEEALARADQALNDALLADRAHLRLIHGRGGGRIRAALHRRLRAIPSVRAFRLDPRNAGVTVVEL